jgi:hypothetical protein
MTEENLPPIPEQTVNLDQLAGPAQANLASDHELNAAEQLAGNLAAVSQEYGPSGITKYLGDVLADTEGKVSPTERQTAFKFLANEQRKALHESSVRAGDVMLGKISTQNSLAERRVGDNGHVTKRITEELIEEHRMQVGRHFRNGVDTRRAVHGHESLEHGVHKGRGAAHELSEVMQDWRRSGRATVEDFADELQRTQNHERALDEAEKITDPTYDGEPRDVSGVIEKAVKQETATKINEAVLQAREEGGDPKEAVLKVMLEDEPDEITNGELTALRAFAEHYEVFTAVQGARLEAEAEKVDFALQRFMRRGQEDYTYARTIDEAQVPSPRQALWRRMPQKCWKPNAATF